MDPTRPESFNHRSERLATGRTYHFVDQIPKNYIPGSTPTLLCLHGFPDLWYGWRFQIGPWTRKGYRTVVPDMLGYGETDMPFDATQYSTKMLCNDLVALLDLLGVSRAIVIGHDWGSYTAGRFALWHPDKLLALVMMSVPYTPPSLNYMPVEAVVSRYQDFGYQAYFATHSSTADIDPKVSYLLQILFRKSDGVMPWTKPGEMKNLLINEREMTGCLLNHKELEYYVSQFSRGVLGPLSYYRTAKVRYEEEKAASLPANLRADLPVLFMWGSNDRTCPPANVRKSHRFIPTMQDVAVEATGHWIMVEASETVTQQVLRWLDARLDGLFTQRSNL